MCVYRYTLVLTYFFHAICLCGCIFVCILYIMFMWMYYIQNTESYRNIYIRNIVVWAHSKWGNSGAEQNQGCDHGVPKAEVHWVGHIAKFIDNRWSQLSSSIWETRNNQSEEDLQDDEKMKLSSNLCQHGEEGQDWKQNRNALYPAIYSVPNFWRIGKNLFLFN